MAKTMGVDKNMLSADDICKILEASSRAGVTTLTVRGLEATFSGGFQQQAAMPFATESPQLEEMSRDAITRDQELLEREQLANMIVENPVEYEKLLLNGEIVDEQEA